MTYQGIVLPILVGVGLVVAAMFYFISQGDSQAPHTNRRRNNGGPPPFERAPNTNSWEQGSNSNSKPKRKRSIQAEQTTCTVCYEELKGDLKTLSCQHKFHVHCIALWLREKQSCPVCRRSATV